MPDHQPGDLRSTGFLSSSSDIVAALPDGPTVAIEGAFLGSIEGNRIRDAVLRKRDNKERLIDRVFYRLDYN